MEGLDTAVLLDAAWEHRDRALVHGRTRVGAAAYAASGRIFGGCNLQHRYRSQDVHAEMCAISTMVGSGERHLVAVAVVATPSLLAPCGACLDWILQLGGDECAVIWQTDRGGSHERSVAGDMLPFHPPYGQL